VKNINYTLKYTFDISSSFNEFLNIYPSSLESVAYTMIWNMLDFPAGVIRFGTESGNKIDHYDHKNDYILRLAQEVCTTALNSVN